MKKLILLLCTMSISAVALHGKTTETMADDGAAENTPITIEYGMLTPKRWQAGITAGLLYSTNEWMLQSGKTVHSQSEFISPKLGFTAGVLGEFRPVYGYGIEFGAKITSSGFKYSEPNDEALHFRKLSLDVPVYFTYYFGRQRDWSIQAGFYATILLSGSVASGNNKASGSDANDAFRRFNGGVVFGVGYHGFALQVLNNFGTTLSSDFLRNIERLVASETGTEIKTISQSFIGASLTYTYKF